MAAMEITTKCPALGGRHQAARTNSNTHWWPNQLNLKVLAQNPPQADPVGSGFDYAEEFKKLDLDELRADIYAVMTTSQDWWPADYGHYGPLLIRMAWHSAGTYRIGDGRGGAASGTLRFAPLNSWPDNANLDKARRLLWPIKQKYGRRLSWADLMIFSGNCALESMGFKTFGFGGGRDDVWQPEEDIYWGPEKTWLGDERYTGDRQLEHPLGAVQMGLIYVNPEGPNGNPDPLKAARDIRETFARMAMNDEETVALIAGGHTFGKTHGAAPADQYVGAEPEGAPVEEQGLGWKNRYATGKGGDTITSGLEGAWTTAPAKWDHGFFENLFGYEWKPTKSPGGASQWIPEAAAANGTVPDAHDANKSHTPVMLTTDLALRADPAYAAISKRFLANPDEFADAFAKAWFKLTHRDMGPVSRYLGPLVPEEAQLWQDPIPAATSSEQLTAEEITDLKQEVLNSSLSISQLVRTAWAAAASYRGTDKRGGANGARVQLAPQKDWPVNNPSELQHVLGILQQIQARYGGQRVGTVSLADLIVLGGCAAVEEAARRAGHATSVSFAPGRTDATQEATDVQSFAVLEPDADGFRNYVKAGLERYSGELLVDRAHMLTLTPVEMTVLVGGLRVLNANFDGSDKGVLTNRPECLTNDFFTNLLDNNITWQPSDSVEHLYEGVNASGKCVWTGSSVDLLFGSNSQLRAIAEVYAADDGEQFFVQQFVSAWTKVMNLDRFDLQTQASGAPQ